MMYWSGDMCPDLIRCQSAIKMNHFYFLMGSDLKLKIQKKTFFF